MMGISADELLTCVLVALCIVLLLLPALILLVHQEDENRQRLMDKEEAEREAVNAILQAYLDGLEKGLSLSRQADYDLFDDMDDQDDDTKKSFGD